jgi:predicted ArsR family transcriptional regulator
MRIPRDVHVLVKATLLVFVPPTVICAQKPSLVSALALTAANFVNPTTMEIEMDRLEAVGDRELRAAFAYVLAQPRAVTADELAGATGTHRNVARWRLERLADAGLLDPGYERRTGRAGPGAGRPAKTYAVTPHLRSIEFPQRRYETLLALLVDALPQRSRRRRLRELGLSFANELMRSVRARPAKTLAAAAERVCAEVRQLGFEAAVAETGTDVAVIETATCPLRPLVRERAGATELDRGFWIGLAARALEGVEPTAIQCDTRSCHGDGRCRVVLTLANE